MRLFLAATTALALVGIHITRASDGSLADATIVVYNRDLSESAQLARFYAEKRGIARNHLVPLACSPEEEISREEYDRTIAEPLRAIFEQRHWWTIHAQNDGKTIVQTNSIRFVAVIKGVPLKIRATTAYPGDQNQGGAVGNRNEAAVDSELAVLGSFSRQISGAVMNPYFRSYRPIAEFNDPSLVLVCRLDAATAVTVRNIIVNAVETEKNGLWGRAYVDAANQSSSGLRNGDEWMQTIVSDFHKSGIPVVYDETPAVFPPGFPMSGAALYYGWYAESVTGPFADKDFRFLPGAVAVHIHSFSANTLRKSNANWVAPLLEKGAAASLGNVYEPYLELTPHLDIFNDRLLHGFTFAESAYMATRTLSWMTVAVGDPLYRPYAAWLQIDAKPGGKTTDEWKMYRDFALKNGARPAREYRTLARQAALRAKDGPMIEDLGLMEARDGNPMAAIGYFQQARSFYQQRDDILRVVLEQANALIKAEKKKQALDLVGSVLRIAPDAPASTLLRKIQEDLKPHPGTVPTTHPQN